MIKFENYLIKEHGVNGPFMDNLYKKLKIIFTYVFKAAYSKINKTHGTFELLGCDIMFDQ